jgi:hypothetical protein
VFGERELMETGLLHIAFITPLIGTLVACGGLDPCGNEQLATALSPDDVLRAVVFQRDCGATTGFSTQVSILQADEPFLTEGRGFHSTKAGNTFIAEKGATPPATWQGGGPWVKVEWSGAGHSALIVHYDSHASVFRRESRVGDVAIQYQPQEPGG